MELTLNDGIQMPALGFGVFQTPPEQTIQAVQTRPDRIRENFDVFDFSLAEAELAAIDVLDTGVRRGPEPDRITLETLGLEIPEA